MIDQSCNEISVFFTEDENKKVHQNINQFIDQLYLPGQSIKYYKRKRSAFQEKLIIQNIYLGKKAEFFTEYALRKFFSFPKLTIDLEIRKGKEKGWFIDLPYFNQFKDTRYPNIHVKACNRYTHNFCQDFSWTFQYKNNDGICGTDTIFNSDNTENNMIALVYLEDTLSRTATIKKVLPWNKINKALKNPVSPKLIGIKKCLYFKDLIRLNV